MKRKDVDYLCDDDFCSTFLPTYSRKSRRLDAELLPIMEEGPDFSASHVLDQGFSEEQPMVHEDAALLETIPTGDASEERALVVYDPNRTPLVKPPSSPDFSIIVNSDLIPGIKDYFLSRSTATSENEGEDEMSKDQSSGVSDDRLAVVPWVAFHSPMAEEGRASASGQALTAEGEMMDMDEPNATSCNEKSMEEVEVEAARAFSPWQQHCMMTNLLHNTCTPISW